MDDVLEEVAQYIYAESEAMRAKGKELVKGRDHHMWMTLSSNLLRISRKVLHAEWQPDPSKWADDEECGSDGDSV